MDEYSSDDDDYYCSDDEYPPVQGSTNTLFKIFVFLHVLIIFLLLFLAVPYFVIMVVLILYLELETRAEEWWRRPKPLPVFRNSQNEVTDDQIRDKDCVICLKEFIHNNQNDHHDEVVVLRLCSHMYHLPCIQHWSTHNKSCPICRQVVERLVVFKITTQKPSDIPLPMKTL
ncbi:43kDa postsynaptic protein [Parasponia andersonii]|uniref:43kDa postsynaptic protein n=1 Tax=Parasponia andersonii TaxID=3476 RepID=A0A2P5A890_PARAD|nr:43kDa postsynaptic protein [Parasponia andersonii]